MPAKIYVEAANCRTISPMHHAVSSDVRLFRISLTNSRTTSAAGQPRAPVTLDIPPATAKPSACMPRSMLPSIPPIYSNAGVHGGQCPSVSQVPRPPFTLASHHHNHHPNTHKVQFQQWNTSYSTAMAREFFRSNLPYVPR
jgi:hypothetical protein